MKEFDINLAKQGKPVCTRSGMPVRIVCFDRKACPDDEESDYTMIVLIDNDKYEELHIYSVTGKANPYIDDASAYDLMIASEKKMMWMNIYKDVDSSKDRCNGGMYRTKEEAMTSININDPEYVTTVKVEWEE